MTQTHAAALFSGPRKVKQYDFELKKKEIERVLGGESVPAACRPVAEDDQKGLQKTWTRKR